MSLLQGSVSLKRFLVLGPVPSEKDLQEGLHKECFRPFEDGLEEERFGWCDWRNPLILPPDENWVSQERFALFSLRIDTRKVPSSLLKAHVDLRIQQLQKEKDLAFIGKEARTSLQDEVKAELLAKVLPVPKTVEVAWDLKGGMLWTTAGSSKTQGALIGLFMKSFGCELQPLAPLLLAGRLAPQISVEGLMALDPLNLELEEA
ncbi:recombination-associated protein RdgC [Holophaga foetida]|uniref:recombination-associated protein RdgC n=1 Tax=Holophaga foetida TaxID=35839 RepID=UPI0002475085|nr:recombination-associated protein RdgC [Holophaga foetida]